ncbi:MAG TPA: adenylate/guanylate cyclase domain-containing protein [Acidimicrobiales bacterium]|nr:adenylate/guanylate cyclase domain-containing protein [Acidimicrobiales bacterium]
MQPEPQVDPEQRIEQALEAFAEGAIPHKRKFTADELAEEAGVDGELARRLRRAMGLPDVPHDEAAFFEEDLHALEKAKALMDEDGLSPAEILHLTRTLGLAASRMADAVVGFWVDRVTSDVATGREGALSTPPEQRVDDLESVVGYLLRRHLLDSVSRKLAETAASEGSGRAVAVGFADLVGFTSLSEQLSDTETAELIERFEVLALDIVVGGGGRVVKMIGDEVMFASDPALVAEIAVSLAESFDSPDLPSVRVGVAVGSVLAQSGDLYGPVVNLASRATMAARPGTVLVSAALAETISRDERYTVRPIRPHKLKGIGTVELSVLRRANEKEKVGGGHK